MGEQGFKARCAQLASQRAGRVLQRLQAVQHQQAAVGDNRFRQRPAFIGGVEAGFDGNAKPFDGLGEKKIFEALRSSPLPWL